MADRCSKCGADLSKDAAFCPLCGAPKEAEQVQPAPVQPQPVVQTRPVAPPKPVKTGPGGMDGFIDFALSLKMMLIGLFIAVLIAWITILVGLFVFGNAGTAMTIINFTFMAGAGGLLLVGGLLNNKLNIYVRAALMVTGGLLLSINL